MQVLSHGGDVERLKGISQQLRALAERSRGVGSEGSRSAAVLTTCWEGADAEDLLTRWDTARRAVEDFAEALSAYGTRLDDEASDQESTSGSAGGAGAGVGAGVGGGLVAGGGIAATAAKVLSTLKDAASGVINSARKIIDDCLPGPWPPIRLEPIPNWPPVIWEPTDCWPLPFDPPIFPPDILREPTDCWPIPKDPIDIDWPIDLPRNPFPPIGLPPIDFPRIPFPPIGLPPIDLPRFPLPPIDLPRIDLPTPILPTEPFDGGDPSTWGPWLR